MIPQYVPPPQQTVPAEVKTINAPHRFESPEQSVINDVNQGKYGDGFKASQDLNNCIEDIGDGVAEAKRAKDRGEENENLINAAKSPGYTDHPPDVPSPETNATAAKKTMPEQQPSSSESAGQSADSGQSNDGGYDYYNGIG